MKYLRRYAFTAIFCMSITFIAAGIFAADESAKRISLGEPQQVVVCGEGAKVYQPARVTDIREPIEEMLTFITETKNRILQSVQNAV